MNRLTDNKIILIKRKTRLEELVARFNTISQAKFYIEHLGADFSDYLIEDENYKRVILKAHNDLENLGRVQIVDRIYVPNFVFGKDDLVVVIGQDGLVANTLKYLNNQLLIGVNPEPKRWEGILTPFQVEDLKLIVQDVFKEKRPVQSIAMAKASLNDGQSIYGVNDLFIGQKTHVSSRYQIQFGNKVEQHSSSGIIVSTGLGETGWLKSVITGANNIVSCLSHQNKQMKSQKLMSWNSEYLYFFVREPFLSKTSQASLVFGKIDQQKSLTILSKMPENGVIFSDGIESDYLEFNSGLNATITVADKTGYLVV